VTERAVAGIANFVGDFSFMCVRLRAYYYYYYYYYYLLQLSFHPVAVALTQSTDKTNNKINETIQKHSTNNTKHSQYKYTYL
jgi:hypothetical protein